MISGFYTAASGILVQQRVINVIGNNITNSQTNGYRAQRVVTSTFEQNYLTRLEQGNTERIGEGDPAVLVDTVETRFDESSLEDTGSPFDMSIVGDGYFTIAGNANTFLTRNGNFNIDEDGYLILPDVGRVQGQNGEIYVGGSDFTVAQDGTVYGADGMAVDQLLISMPAEGAELFKFNNGMFTCDTVDTMQAPTVYQKMLERSNVDMNDEYTRMIESQRALQACATALKTVDEMNGRAATLASIS